MTYGAIGTVGATLDFLVYSVLVMSTGIWPALATIISVTIGILNNFLMNAHWNFKVRGGLWRRWWSFYSVGLTGVVISALAVWLLVSFASTGPLIAKLMSIPPVVLGQFLVNRRYAFAPADVPQEARR